MTQQEPPAWHEPNGINGDDPAYKQDDEELGYRAVNLWPDATPQNAELVAINPTAQAEAEEILWSLRQTRGEPSRL